MLWHFLGIVMLVTLAAGKGRVGQAGPFWMILAALPTTILHEASHFFIALLTCGRPVGFSLWPRREQFQMTDGQIRTLWTLGSVRFHATAFSAFPTCLAPLFFLPLAYFVFRHWFEWVPATGPWTLLLYLAVYLLIGASIPSRQDIEVLGGNPGSLILYAGLGIFGYAGREWLGGWVGQLRVILGG